MSKFKTGNKISKKNAYKYGKNLGIDFRKIKLSDFTYGINVEKEHGKINKLTNVTDNDLLLTAKITLAHLLESKLYYRELKKMEKKLNI